MRQGEFDIFSPYRQVSRRNFILIILANWVMYNLTSRERQRATIASERRTRLFSNAGIALSRFYGKVREHTHAHTPTTKKFYITLKVAAASALEGFSSSAAGRMGQTRRVEFYCVGFFLFFFFLLFYVATGGEREQKKNFTPHTAIFSSLSSVKCCALRVLLHIQRKILYLKKNVSFLLKE